MRRFWIARIIFIFDIYGQLDSLSHDTLTWHIHVALPCYFCLLLPPAGWLDRATSTQLLHCMSVVFFCFVFFLVKTKEHPRVDIRSFFNGITIWKVQKIYIYIYQKYFLLVDFKFLKGWYQRIISTQ